MLHMSTLAWKILTALGDGALLLPCALMVLIWLLAMPTTRRTGWLWLLAVFADGGVVALTKVLYMGWRLYPPGLDFTGLSGDSAMSFLFWPMMGALMAGQRRPKLRVVTVALGGCLALGITISRVLLHYHSLSEAILGSFWGALLTAVFLTLTWRHPAVAPAIRVGMTVSVLLLAFVTYTHGFPSKRLLTWAALRASRHTIVYTRCNPEPQADLKQYDKNCRRSNSKLHKGH